MNKGFNKECSFYTDFWGKKNPILTFFSTSRSAVRDLKAFFKDYK